MEKKPDLWRGRMKETLSPSTIHFISSLADDERLIDIEMDVWEAHALMLHKQGIISDSDIGPIIRAEEEIRKELRKMGLRRFIIRQHIKKAFLEKLSKTMDKDQIQSLLDRGMLTYGEG